MTVNGSRPQSGARAKAASYLRRHGDRVAWIMGSSRSGSSWLLRMLASLDPVATIDDPHIGHHLSVWRPLPLAWATATEPPRLRTLCDVKRTRHDYFFADEYRDAWLPALGELIRTRFGAQLADQVNLGEQPRLVVKEPSSHPAEILLEAIPNSRLVFLLRDGRDVVDSWLDAYRDGSWAIEEGAYPVSADGRLALIEWLASVWAFRTRELAKCFAGLQPGRRVLVRYEHLLRDPGRELVRISRLLGLDSSSEELERVAGEHAFDGVDPADRGALREIRRARPGGWQVNLTPAEQEVLHAAMGDELTVLGYEMPTASAA